MSMMAHKTKVLPGLTFRLQLAVVAPYNGKAVVLQLLLTAQQDSY